MLKGIGMYFWLFDQRGNFEIYCKISTYRKKTLCTLISICSVGYLHITLNQYKKCKCKKNITLYNVRLM